MLVPATLASLPPQRPNIVFIFTDDHASHAISAYGSKINKTPHLDELAAEGALFNNCFVTNSICAPSRAVILTGKHSHLNGVRDNEQTFDGAQQTFPKLLQRAGYTTAMIGKWHLKSDPTGFDHYQILIGQGEYYNPRIKTPQGTTRLTGYTTEVITQLGKEWLASRPKDKPFLLMLQHKAPHRNWQPSPKYLNLFKGQTIPEPPDLFDDWSTKSSKVKDNEMSIAKHLELDYDLKTGLDTWGQNETQFAQWSRAYADRRAAKQNLPFGKDLVRLKYQWYIKDYLRCIQSVDDSVGEVNAFLKQNGLDKNTIVIYSSDQGFYLGDYGWYDKRWMYEPSLRTPLIVKWPGVTKPGSQIKGMAQNLDFAQTMLAMAGVAAPTDMQGVNLTPLLKNQKSSVRETLYYHYYEYPAVHMVPKHRGVRTDRYKLIHFYETDEWELYDLQTDPRERLNLYGKPQVARLQAQMHQKLEAEAAKAKDTTWKKDS